MIHPKIVGDRTEALVFVALVLNFPSVLTPHGENSRYDYVVDTGHGFVSVQAKTGRLNADRSVIEFSACSSTVHHANGTQRDYLGQVDLFGVTREGFDDVWLVPPSLAGKRLGTIRLAPSKNNQRSRVPGERFNIKCVARQLLSGASVASLSE